MNTIEIEFISLIRLVINYRFVQRMASQMNALRQGFQEILPLDNLKIFDEKEVEVKQSK
jgi:E3 ubiquitin-protein ligase NEDD4-like